MSPVTCSIDGCTRPVKSRDLCSMHRSRLERWGTLDDNDDRAYKYGQPIDRFVRRIDPQPNGCWLWAGSRGGDGYGYLSIDGRNCRAHRWAYEWFVGPIPAGLVTDHVCCTPLCVNSDHLELVTPQENTRRWKARTGPGPNRKESGCFAPSSSASSWSQ